MFPPGAKAYFATKLLQMRHVSMPITETNDLGSVTSTGVTEPILYFNTHELKKLDPAASKGFFQSMLSRPSVSYEHLMEYVDSVRLNDTPIHSIAPLIRIPQSVLEKDAGMSLKAAKEQAPDTGLSL